MSTTTRPRATKKYKALIAAGLNDNEALGVLGITPEQADVEVVVDPRIEALKDGGFTEEQALQILTDQDAGTKVKGKKKGKKAKVTAAIKAEAAEVLAASLSPKQRAEALVAERGLAFTRGRVYVTGELIEAQARVMKTGAPEVGNASGVGRVSAVLIYREESGDVALQNLSKPV